jgi:hypothetical protein
VGCFYWFGGSIMLTTGFSEIDDSFKKSNTINSSHKVIAEWNQNAYKKIDYIGSYPIDLRISSRIINMTNYIGSDTTTVTGTSAANHGLISGDTIIISGASGTQQEKLNGEWKILSTPTNLTFTFIVTSSLTSGTITTGIGTTTNSDPTYSKTFNSNQTIGGWDNGGYFYVIPSTSSTPKYLENLERKKTISLLNVVEPERPDPGIVNGFIVKNIDSSVAGSPPNIVDDIFNIKVQNFLQSKNRIYSANESQGFKYWTSIRYPKPNTTTGVVSEVIGVSNNNYRMKGNNAFVYYGINSTIITNKIVVKTQTVNGFPEDFKVEVIKSNSIDNTWTTIFTEDSTTRSSRSFTKTGEGQEESYIIELNNHLNIYIGMNVSGTGIAPDTKVSSILPDGAIMVDKPLSQDISNATLTFVDYPFSDGILRLTGTKTTGDISWTIAGGVETEANITNLEQDKVSDGITEVETIKAIRFSVQKLSRKNGTLDIIEISPRLVVDISKYVESISIDSSIGDEVLGLPIGSMVSTDGTIGLFNYDQMLTNKNNQSILFGLLKPNVKFTVLNVLKLDNITRYVPIKVLYANSWDEDSDSAVTVSVEDYLKFLKLKPAPDILTGALDGIKVSALIKILLDNAGFNRFSFEKTGDEEEYESEDTRVDFFWSRKENSVAEVLDSLASSTQLSIFIDQFGNLVAKTKESVLQRTDTYDYWLVGDYADVQESDSEYPFIYEKYTSNIESFQDRISPPITSGEVVYSGLGIEKISVLDENFASGNNKLTDAVSAIVSSGYGDIALNRAISYNPSGVWTLGQGEEHSGDAYLSSGILVRNIEDVRPKTILQAITDTSKYPIQAKNKEDAIRKAFNLLTDTQKLSAEIVISENSLTRWFQTKFSGYILADTELIKYNGIRYLVSRPGYYAESKIYFSRQQVESDISKAPSGSSFVPYSLIVDLNMEIFEYPITNTSSYKFICKDDGRGNDNTLVVPHKSGLDKTYLWEPIAVNLFADTSGQKINLGQSLKIAMDTGVPDVTDTSKNIFAYGGFGKMSGPPSNKIEGQNLGAEVSESRVKIKYKGQRWITGYKRELDFIPYRIGTRMMILEENESSSNIGGISFFLSNINNGPQGYFLEISSAAEAYNPNGTADDNIKLYRVNNVDGKRVPTVIGTAYVPVSSLIGSPEAINNIDDFNKLEVTTKTVFALDVSVSGPVAAGSTKTFVVRIDGAQAMKVTDKDSLAATNDVGMFVRDDSAIVLDHIYAVTKDASTYVPAKSENAYKNLFYNDAVNKNNRGSFSPFIASLYGKPEEIFYEDFGNTVREVKKIEARFAQPVFDSRLVELSEISPDYFVRDYKSTSFGASFWIYNTTNGIVGIGEGAEFPLWIYGFILQKMKSSSVDIGKFIDDHTKEDEINNTVQLNRKLYGNQSVEVSGEYLNNRYEAERLAEWIARYATTEKITINASIFPNPLLQLGDKIKVFYKENGYRKAQSGDKVFTLSAISYLVSESGIEMSVELRECI